MQDGSVHETLEAPGEVDIYQLAQVTEPIPGRIRSIHKLTGDAVDRGSVLCTIESAELGGARADLQSAAAETAVTKRNLDRLRQLFDKGLRSESEVWASEAEYNKARLHVDAATAHLRALGINPDQQRSEGFFIPQTRTCPDRRRDPRKGLIVICVPLLRPVPRPYGRFWS